jgi:hypothetical protein
MGETRNAYKILIGNPEGKKPIGIPMSRKEGLREKDFVGVGRMDLVGNMDR